MCQHKNHPIHIFFLVTLSLVVCLKPEPLPAPSLIDITLKISPSYVVGKICSSLSKPSSGLDAFLICCP